MKVRFRFVTPAAYAMLECQRAEHGQAPPVRLHVGWYAAPLSYMGLPVGGNEYCVADAYIPHVANGKLCADAHIARIDV